MKLRTILFLLGVTIVIISCNKTRICECTETTLSTGETKTTTSSVGGDPFKSNNQQVLEEKCSLNNAANSKTTKNCVLKD